MKIMYYICQTYSDMNKCIIFLRVSTQAQEFESQKQSLTQLAINLGYPPECHIPIGQKESGISLSAEERISIQELEQAVLKDSDIDCLLCWELSRIGRRADVIYHVRDFLIAHHVRWIINNPYTELIDSEFKVNPTANLILSVFTAFVENEMVLKKERFARGKSRSKQMGKYTGGTVTFGYEVDAATKKWIPHPVNAETVQRIFTMYATGNYSLRTISSELIDEGLFPGYTVLSLTNTICRWLKSDLYYGASTYPALISKELFDAVQKQLAAHKNEYRIRNVSGFLCKRLLYNKNTGYALVCKAKTGLASGSNDRSIYVSDHRRGNGVNILQHAIDPVAWECAKMLYSKYVMNIDIYRDSLQKRYDLVNDKYNVALTSKTKLQEQIDKVEERLIYGKISEQKANQIVDELKLKLNEYNIKVSSLLLEQAECMKQLTDSWTKKDIDLENISFEQKYDIVHQVIEKIWISKPNPQLRMTVADIVSKVDDKVYVYQIKTKKVSWKLIQITKKKRPIDLSVSFFNHSKGKTR